MGEPHINGEELMRRMIKVLEEHFIPVRSSLLDGTSSCMICRAICLEENADQHYRWHRKAENCPYCGSRLAHGLTHPGSGPPTCPGAKWDYK